MADAPKFIRSNPSMVTGQKLVGDILVVLSNIKTKHRNFLLHNCFTSLEQYHSVSLEQQAQSFAKKYENVIDLVQSCTDTEVPNVVNEEKVIEVPRDMLENFIECMALAHINKVYSDPIAKMSKEMQECIEKLEIFKKYAEEINQQTKDLVKQQKAIFEHYNVQVKDLQGADDYDVEALLQTLKLNSADSDQGNVDTHDSVPIPNKNCNDSKQIPPQVFTANEACSDNEKVKSHVSEPKDTTSQKDVVPSDVIMIDLSDDEPDLVTDKSKQIHDSKKMSSISHQMGTSTCDNSTFNKRICATSQNYLLCRKEEITITPLLLETSAEPLDFHKFVPKPFVNARRLKEGLEVVWSLHHPEKYSDLIKEYELYIGQSSITSENMTWKKQNLVAHALPMTCYLSNFIKDRKYYFMVRAIGKCEEMGEYSDIESICF